MAGDWGNPETGHKTEHDMNPGHWGNSVSPDLLLMAPIAEAGFGRHLLNVDGSGSETAPGVTYGMA